MVLYYSATGNTKFIATELARCLGDECLDLLGRIKSADTSPIHSDRPFVVCAPVYVCEIPRFLTAWLKKANFTGSRQVYFVLTSGGYCGIAGPMGGGIFRSGGGAAVEALHPGPLSAGQGH